MRAVRVIHRRGHAVNVVFDLGGVVVRWAPEAFLADVYPDPAVRAKVREGLVDHDDWHALDRGTLSSEVAIRRAAGRTGLEPETVARFLDHVPDALVPMRETVALLEDLRRAGHALYYLSNMHEAFLARLEARPCMRLFVGGVFSCRAGLVKPEPAIYEHLLAAHGLDAGATLFIDDVERNVEAAAAVGLDALRFEDSAQCRRALAERGVARAP